MDTDSNPFQRSLTNSGLHSDGTRDYPDILTSDGSDDETILGVEGIWKSLEELGIDVVFGAHSRASHVVSALPPGARRWMYVQIAHEADVGNAAIGYARATGRPGICMSVTDSAATSLTTALASAQRDSVPLVAVTVRSTDQSDWTDERSVDIVGVTMSITKHNFVVADPCDLLTVLSGAFHLASTGRPGAVLIDISSRVLLRQMKFSWPREVRLPGYRPTVEPRRKQVLVAAHKIASAHSPVVCVGGGAVAAGASAELLAFVELTGIPAVTTDRARGVLSDGHRLNYGMLGPFGSAAANAALDGSDLIIALGTRFDRSVSAGLDVCALKAELVHIDIDPEVIGRYRPAEVSIVGDCRRALEALCTALREQDTVRVRTELAEWRAHLDATVSTDPEAEEGAATNAYLESILRSISQRAATDAIFVCGEGPHRRLTVNLLRFDKPRLWLGSGAEQGLGSSLAVAIGAQIGSPSAQVWVLETGATLGRSLHGLVTAVELGVPLKIVLLGDRFDRTMQAGGPPEWGASSSEVFMSDVSGVARSLGCVVVNGCNNTLIDTLNSAVDVADRPVLVDFSHCAT